jgi:hypothetical protein
VGEGGEVSVMYKVLKDFSSYKQGDVIEHDGYVKSFGWIEQDSKGNWKKISMTVKQLVEDGYVTMGGKWLGERV